MTGRKAMRLTTRTRKLEDTDASVALPACLLLTLLLLALLLPVSAASAAEPSDQAAVPTQASELERLVRNLCDRDVVLLGEDGVHGSGQTFSVKVELVRRLVEECGFSALMFESQIYDFLDLERAFAAGSATPEQLLDAIGGLWSVAGELDPLVSFLFERAKQGEIRLVGLDPQIGGATQLFTQARLPAYLSSLLSGERRAACETELYRLTNWQFDEQVPFNEATHARLLACAKDIAASTTANLTTASARQAAHMATNLASYLDIMSSNDVFNVRDRAMFDNFEWHRARLPKDSKAIIWCATVHAAKSLGSLHDERVSLGEQIQNAVGDRAVAIGFSAVAGSYGRPGRDPMTIDVADPASLEGRAFSDWPANLRYLDRQQLERFGSIAARPLRYSQVQEAEWAHVLDGLVVLRQEQPPDFVRQARSQRTAPSAL